VVERHRGNGVGKEIFRKDRNLTREGGKGRYLYLRRGHKINLTRGAGEPFLSRDQVVDTSVKNQRLVLSGLDQIGESH
jgi:hypothetical protein